MIDLLIATAAAQSAVLPRDPMATPVIAYLWVLAWSAAGGLVSFYQKFKRGEVRAFNLVELAGELFCSGFVGLITYWICEAASVPPGWQPPIIAISGHMSTRLLFIFEKAMLRYAEQKVGVKVDVPEDEKP